MMNEWKRLVNEQHGSTSALEVPGGLVIRSYHTPNSPSESMVFLPGEFHLVKHGSNCHDEWYEIKTGPQQVVKPPAVGGFSDEQLQQLADAAVERVKGLLSMNGYRQRIRDIVKSFQPTTDV